jgi:hypothetical protein
MAASLAMTEGPMETVINKLLDRPLPTAYSGPATSLTLDR